MNYNENALVLSSNNNQTVPCCNERNSHKEIFSNNDYINLEAPPFSLQQNNNVNTIPVNLKDKITGVIDAIPADIFEAILEAIVQLFVLSFTPRANGGHSPQMQAIPADTYLKDIIQSILSTYSMPFMPGKVGNDKEFSNKVKLVYKAILELNKKVFKKVEITVALQKKLKAREIAEVIDFLISEGGVIEEIEQTNKSNGRSPSPQYIMIFENPKYPRI